MSLKWLKFVVVALLVTMCVEAQASRAGRHARKELKAFRYNGYGRGHYFGVPKGSHFVGTGYAPRVYRSKRKNRELITTCSPGSGRPKADKVKCKGGTCYRTRVW